MDLEKLFEQWQEKYRFDAFIRDGIVDPERYEHPHILFVLRDMNCGVETDLRQHLFDHGSGWRTWNNVARWTHALLDGCGDYPQHMPKERRRDLVRRIAAVNIKKEGGGSRSNAGKLSAAAEEQGDMLYSELCLCQPELIVCCGLGSESNAELLRKYVLPDCSDWQSFRSARLPWDWWYYYTSINGRTIPVISFCHPQVTNLCGKRGHEALFKPLYEDMLTIRKMFL